MQGKAIKLPVIKQLKKENKVSYVGVVREVRIIFSPPYGIIYLGEKHTKQKFLGALLIALGVVLICISR